MPSEHAPALFRRRVGRHGRVDVDDATLSLYRELAGHGLVAAVGAYAGGPEAAYRVTRLGFDRKAELPAFVKSSG